MSLFELDDISNKLIGDFTGVIYYFKVPSCDDLVFVETDKELMEILMKSIKASRIVDIFIDKTFVDGVDGEEIYGEIDDEDFEDEYKDPECWDTNYEMLDDDVVITDEVEKHLIGTSITKGKTPLVMMGTMMNQVVTTGKELN
ncbi:hypothetical protein TorRG33x02_355760 [Trema orientale]|uniref:Uncharacterized protein n=1 Tax=Trema orientale TaxID=63057 RepID=A0A2P5A8T0_TREOI|nr:hypothetical protein TorRG33x02_355760 [Trema orientale]